MTTFPEYAKILLAGFSESPIYGVVRTEFDGGLAEQDARPVTVTVSRSATIHVESLADKRSFDTWFETTLNGGVKWFLWDDPVDGVTKRTRFKGTIEWGSPGVVWRAACELETIG